MGFGGFFLISAKILRGTVIEVSVLGHGLKFYLCFFTLRLGNMSNNYHIRQLNKSIIYLADNPRMVNQKPPICSYLLISKAGFILFWRKTLPIFSQQLKIFCKIFWIQTVTRNLIVAFSLVSVQGVNKNEPALIYAATLPAPNKVRRARHRAI